MLYYFIDLTLKVIKFNAFCNKKKLSFMFIFQLVKFKNYVYQIINIVLNNFN